MTPIAHRFVRERMTATEAVNSKTNQGKFPTDLTEMRCFDCTAVTDLARDLKDSMWDHVRVPEKIGFLPAPITWIEYMLKGDVRGAFWLIDEGDGYARCGSAIIITKDDIMISPMRSVIHVESVLPLGDKVCTMPIGHIQLSDNVDQIGIGMRAYMEHMRPEVRDAALKGTGPEHEVGTMFLIYAFLAIINTPRIVGRKTHHAHKGLEREMNLHVPAKDRKKLPEWTEIVLEVDKPARDGDASERSEILTGKRALHFCRSFIRIRRGKLELVRSHWRGDEELGVRQASYRVKRPGEVAA